jgi:hypothetical protein
MVVAADPSCTKDRYTPSNVKAFGGVFTISVSEEAIASENE